MKVDWGRIGRYAGASAAVCLLALFILVWPVSLAEMASLAVPAGLAGGLAGVVAELFRLRSERE